eukprot:scaffold134362_cov37-Prasinocladus_malaysianus.AAC.1
MSIALTVNECRSHRRGLSSALLRFPVPLSSPPVLARRQARKARPTAFPFHMSSGRLMHAMMW